MSLTADDVVRYRSARETESRGCGDAGAGGIVDGLFDTRLDGDYEDLIAFDDEKVRPLIGQARRFVASIESPLQ